MGIASDLTISFAPTGDSLASLSAGWASAEAETWSAGAESHLVLPCIQDAGAARPKDVSNICDDRYPAVALSEAELLPIGDGEEAALNSLPSRLMLGLPRLAQFGKLTVETILDAEEA